MYMVVKACNEYGQIEEDGRNDKKFTAALFPLEAR